MKKILLLAVCCCNLADAFAQQAGAPAAKPGLNMPATVARGNAGLRGVVQDAATQAPIEFATVAVLQAASGKAIDGTVCDAKGKFEIAKLAAGDYKITVSFLGYKAKTLAGFYLDATAEKDFGVILLEPETNKLNEVNVTATRELFENKIDRLVYNAEKDASNAGGNAADVLKKVPQLAVDLDGNVQLRGSSNIKVLINNKPSSIMAASVAEALKQIPSDMIKTVEVITSPSARYDAEGTAGIINIITKKTSIEGFNGSVYSTYGTLSNNVGASLNQRFEKLGLYANVGSNYWHVKGKTNTIRQDFGQSQINTLNQQADFENKGRFNSFQLGADYDLNPKNTLNAGLRINNSTFRNHNDLASAYSAGGLITDSFFRDIANRTDNNSVDLNLGYTRLFAKPQQELSLLGLYSRSARNNVYLLNQTDETGRLTYREKNPNDNVNEETTFQADYVQPLKNKQLLETGAKAILRTVFSDYRFANDPSGNGEFVSRPALSDVFTYDQDVLAGYVSYGFNLAPKYSFKIGSRFEQTFIKADFKSTDQAFSGNYHNLIPSLLIAKDLTDNQKLKFAYTRRIQRPLIFYLNPYINAADTFNISYGNPNLKPELTDNFELGYNTFFKAGSANVSLYWRQTNNAIETVRSVNPETNVATTTYQNIAKNNTLGLSLFGSVKPWEKFSLSGNANFYYTQLHSEALHVTNSNLQANFNLNASWQFKESWSAEVFGFYNSPRVQLQGKISGMRYYNFAVKKEILKKKGSISVGLDNVFESSTLVRTTYQTPNSDLATDMNFYRRGIRVSFNYQFGKMQFNPQSRKKSIKNDDVKQEGGNG